MAKKKKTDCREGENKMDAISKTLIENIGKCTLEQQGCYLFKENQFTIVFLYLLYHIEIE